MSNATSTTFTYDEDTFSDLYKDVYGFRPRGHRFYDATPEEKQEIWDDLCDSLDREIINDRRRYWEAGVRFEKRVEETIKAGAGDRETAIRWIKDAEDVLGDYDEDDALCWACDLPFGYFGTGMFGQTTRGGN